jgi:hypothetical protein
MYEFEPGKGYRMPTHFGPSLGPRQGPEGRRFENRESPRTVAVSVSFASDPAVLASLLPPGFSVAGSARVSVRATNIRDIEWLAGRGYNTLGVSISAEYKGAEAVSGEFLVVLWENSADAIVTGREELGYNKIFAELPDLRVSSDETAVSTCAAWDGFEFLRLRGESLQATVPSEADPPPILNYKYVPATGKLGGADVAYPTITPRRSSDSRVIRALSGTGSLEWSPGTWEELPTLEPIVSRLAALPVLDEPIAGLVEVVGGQDLSETRPLA